MGRISNQKSKASSKMAMAKDKLLGKVAFGLHTVQHQWATCMHRHSERLSRKGKLTMLVCFTFFSSVYCCYLIAKGLTRTETARVTMPEIKAAVRVNPEIATPLPKQEIVRVLQFKKHLDSLAHSPGGDHYYQELVRRHPGLMDSLAAFKMIYGAASP